jgi:hypothetical protein
MQGSLKITEALLDEARKVTGLLATATADDVLRHFVSSERQRRAVDQLEGIGWEGAHHSRPSFDTLAAEFRALTGNRQHTPSEELMREGRAER